MHYRLISCRVFEREMLAAIARSPHEVDLECLPKGLHDLPCGEMRARVQAALDSTDPTRYDAVLFGYGLCNNGLDGLTAKLRPLVVPRAHDCITLFLGSRKRYLDYFQNHPGTYFLTSGWIDHGEVTGELKELSIQHAIGMDRTYDALVEQYGVDNARFLFETLCKQDRHYGRFAFIEMGIEPDDRFEKIARQRATERGWDYEKVRGSMALIEKLVAGNWDEQEFLIVRPGYRVKADYSPGILRSVPVADEDQT